MDFDVTTDRDSSAWLARLRSGHMTATEQRRFDAWLAIPANRAEFQALSRAFERLGQMAEDPAVLSARTAALQRAGKPWSHGIQALAATLVAAVLVSVLLFAMPRLIGGDRQSADEVVATADNQRKQANLEDGSTLILDADSEIAIRFGKAERQIFLRRGRAYFTVAKDPSRPFVVHTGFGSVYAVGTAFSVDGRKDGVKVLLAEGKVRVEVDPGRAPAGHRIINMVQGTELSVDRKGWAIKPKPADQELAWTKGLIVFDDVRLVDAVAEFNATSRREIILGDGLDRLRISGTFRSGMAEDFSKALEAYGIARIADEDQKQIRLVGVAAK